jgi:hypothetical protein
MRTVKKVLESLPEERRRKIFEKSRKIIEDELRRNGNKGTQDIYERIDKESDVGKV